MIGHDLDTKPVNIGYEADVTAHLLDTNGKEIGVTGLLGKDLGKNGLHEGRSNSDESPTGCSQSRSDLRRRKNTNNGPPRGRTRSLEELPGGRDFVRNFDVMVDLNNGLIRIRNPDRKYVKKPIKRIITDENKEPIFYRKVGTKQGTEKKNYSRDKQ